MNSMTFEQAAAEARAWFASLSDHAVIGLYLEALVADSEVKARLAAESLLGLRPSWSATTPHEWAQQYSDGCAHHDRVMAAWRQSAQAKVAS